MVIDILGELQDFASYHSRKLTDIPVKLTWAVLAKHTGMDIGYIKNQNKNFIHIELNKRYLKFYTNDIRNTKHMILHELAHIPCVLKHPNDNFNNEVSCGHGEEFRRTAKMVGVSESHIATDVIYMRQGSRRIPHPAKVMGKYPKHIAHKKQLDYEHKGHYTSIRKSEDGDDYYLVISTDKRR